MSDECRLSQRSLVADVGRTTIRVGFTNALGHLDQDSVREYDPKLQPTVSSSISAFLGEHALRHLPKRAAIAVSGVPRGETISITNSRWILSRPGLTAILGTEPLIINDFAATGWAIASSHTAGRIATLGAFGVEPHKPGTYCIIGIGSGLGVAAVSRDRHGMVNVVPTEAGHMCLMEGLPLRPALLQRLRDRAIFTAESLISGPGLLSLHSAVCELNRAKEMRSLRDILNPAQRSNPLVAETLEAFASAFWYFAGNIVLAYGAWDGLILTGSIAAQSKSALERSIVRRHFAISGPFADRLAAVPAAMASFRYAELEGAAAALIVDDTHRSFTQGSQSAAAETGEGTPAQSFPTSGAANITKFPAGKHVQMDRAFARPRRPACA